MNVEKLEQIQRSINSGKAISQEDSGALVAEVWRLRTALSAKSIEADYWRMSTDDSKRELEVAVEAKQTLQLEFDQHKALHGLVKCDLENRWSNCMVRIRKRAQKT
jgi:hypothetical protein